MSSTSRRKFSAQFKAEAVQLVVQSDRPIVEVAGELGINPGTLGNWVKKYRLENPEPDKKMTPADHGRLAELEEQNRRLKMENEFLKKPRPSSPGSRTEREISPDRGGEGELPDRLDVRAARRAPLLVLRLACPRRPGHRHPGPPRGTQGRDPTYLRRATRHGRMPPYRLDPQRRGSPGLGRAGGRSDARARPGGEPAQGLQAHHHQR